MAGQQGGGPSGGARSSSSSGSRRERKRPGCWRTATSGGLVDGCRQLVAAAAATAAGAGWWWGRRWVEIHTWPGCRPGPQVRPAARLGPPSLRGRLLDVVGGGGGGGGLQHYTGDYCCYGPHHELDDGHASLLGAHQGRTQPSALRRSWQSLLCLCYLAGAARIYTTIPTLSC